MLRVGEHCGRGRGEHFEKTLGNGGAVVGGMIWLGLPRSLGATAALHPSLVWRGTPAPHPCSWDHMALSRPLARL